MTNRNLTPPDAVLVAIDMSKHRQEVLIEHPDGGRRRRITVMATKTHYDRLASDLADIGRPVVVGFEATGNYHRTLAHRLLSAGFELRLISSGRCDELGDGEIFDSLVEAKCRSKFGVDITT